MRWPLVARAVLALALAWSFSLFASEGPADARRTERPRTVCHPIEFFTRENCAQCDRAEAFLKALAQRRPEVQFTRHDVVKEQPWLKRLYELCRHHRVEKSGVPGVLVANQFFVGYKDDETTGKRIEELLTIEVFTREGCPHCAKAREFLRELEVQYPGVKIEIRDVVKSPAALNRMHEIAERHRVQVPSLPMFSLYGKVIVGYRDGNSTGREIRNLIEKSTIWCDENQDSAAPRTTAKSATKSASPANRMTLSPELHNSWNAPIVWSGAAIFGALPEDPLVPPEEIPALDEVSISPIQAPLPDTAAVSPPQDEIEVPLLGKLSVSRLGMPTFTFLLGLVDGFNPCAMWVLIFLLSVLVNLKDRRKIVAIAGTFVLISGLAYFAFMAAWLNVFLLIGLTRWAQIALGALAVVIGLVNVKDFVAFGRGVSFSIPESAKPGIYARVREIVSAKYLTAAIAGAIVLAVLVNTIELLCTAGIPALYTQILTFQAYPLWKNYLYLALYNVAYMLDDSVMLTIAVATLSHRRLQEREGRWLKLISGAVILALGLTLLFKPAWLV